MKPKTHSNIFFLEKPCLLLHFLFYLLVNLSEIEGYVKLNTNSKHMLLQFRDYALLKLTPLVKLANYFLIQSY